VSKVMLINISKIYYCISTQTRANASDGEMLSLAMGRLHLTKSETKFNTDRTATYGFVVRPV
jgi:hypothetical protein